MSKAKPISLELVPSSSAPSALSVVKLKTRAERITTYHQGVVRAFGQQMGYAFLAGLELNGAKEQLPHGEFEKWRAKALPDLPKRTACRYQSFADTLQKHSASLADLTQQAPQLLAQGQFSEAHRSEILEAVHEVMDGKSMTEFMRDLDTIRQPKKPVHTPPAQLTPEEEEASLNQAAEQTAQALIAALLNWRDDNRIRARIAGPLRKQIIEACVQVANDERATLKANKASSQKKTKATKKGAK